MKTKKMKLKKETKQSSTGNLSTHFKRQHHLTIRTKPNARTGMLQTMKPFIFTTSKYFQLLYCF